MNEPSVPDEELASELARGDGEPFAILFDRHRRGVYNYVLRLCGRRHDAEEITQDVFMRMLKHCRAFRGESRFKSWLWTIATNACRDHLRKRRTKQKHKPQMRATEETLADNSTQPEARALTEERAQHVRQALLELSDDERAVVVLRHYENMKFAEIARMLDIPLSTAKSRMRYAFEKLERSLKPLMR